MSGSPSESVPSTLSLGEVAELVSGGLEGDPEIRIVGVSALDEAGPEDLALFTSRRYTHHVAGSGAAAFLVTDETMARLGAGRPRVVVRDASRALIAILGRLHPVNREPAGIHPTAILGEGVRLGDDVGIGAYSVVGDHVDIGSGCRIGPHVVIGRDSVVGSECTLHPQSVLYPRTVLGDRVIIHSGVRVGGDGFGYATYDGSHHRIPHVGRAVIDSDVEIGPNSTVDRGSVGDTHVGTGVKIDNLVMVAHNVQVGEHSMLAALVGIAGSTRVGKGVWMGGQAGAINHLDIGDGARVAVATKVLRDVPAGETVSGHPARPHREDLSRQANLGRLPKLVERVKVLEAEIEALKRGLGG